MMLLALDTCDSRGSLAILRDDEVLQVVAHDAALDYSSWILPACESALAAAGSSMPNMGTFAVGSGPGSFTGLRVGLTTVKAWSVVYGTPIAPVSRLEAIATQAAGLTEYVAAFFDAQRGQVFGALYRRHDTILKLIDEELVIAPEDFLRFVEQRAGQSPISWISLDPEKITSVSGWSRHSSRGEQVQLSEHLLAPMIGRIGRQMAVDGRLKDALGLDAQYIRRSDAEIFWKGGAKRGA